mmetsp:Transcript_14603/g.45628  ORF Transcript_14603/g.45628 Transcript_14603/m.45628 type:complete len:274 (-) Transcript_14603:183-1004(-)
MTWSSACCGSICATAASAPSAALRTAPSLVVRAESTISSTPSTGTSTASAVSLARLTMPSSACSDSSCAYCALAAVASRAPASTGSLGAFSAPLGAAEAHAATVARSNRSSGATSAARASAGRLWTSCSTATTSLSDRVGPDRAAAPAAIATALFFARERFLGGGVASTRCSSAEDALPSVHSRSGARKSGGSGNSPSRPCARSRRPASAVRCASFSRPSSSAVRSSSDGIALKSAGDDALMTSPPAPPALTASSSARSASESLVRAGAASGE